jgi:aminoglycoside phosphotransferase (APT) family kinase protein
MEPVRAHQQVDQGLVSREVGEMTTQLVDRLKRPIIKSALFALPAAIIAIGAADRTNLPAALQYLVAHLDIASYFPMEEAFPDQTRAFEFWVLPINATFYATLLYAFFYWRGRRPRLNLLMARSAASGVAATPLTVDDPDIPTLGSVLDSAKLCKQLQALSVSPGAAALREVQVNVLERGGSKRCTLEIALRTDMIGKVYARDRRDVYEVMEAISRAGFGPEAEFSIPKAIAYIPSLRLLLQERVNGVLAKKIFRFGNDCERAAAAESCARWLTRFQALAPPSGLVLDVDRILTRSERKQRLISQEGEPFASKSALLLERLRAAASSLAVLPMCAGHGDFGSYQVILAEGRTVVFDWDLYNVADPTRDVAKFVVSLERLALRRLGSIRALDGALEVFIRTYLASGGSPQVAAHLPFYRAVFCFNGASRDIQAKARAWHERAEAMLDAGLRALGANGPATFPVALNGRR